MSETVKTLLKNGTVVSGDISVREDVLIDGEKIVKVGRNLEAEDAQVVDVNGKLLFPGFIDGHTHFDLEVAGTVTADDFENHPLVRPDIMEAEAVHRLLVIADAADAPVMVVHLTNRKAFEEVMRARMNGQKVYAETCPQYLLLDDSVYSKPDFEGAKYVCAPPIRKKADQDCLWKALANDQIQTVATDQCSFTMEQKALGKDDFTKIPGGLPGVQTRGTLLYTYGVRTGRITQEQMCRLLSENAAKLYGVYPNKGVIREGSDADIVVFDPEKESVISAKTHLYHTDNNPYEGFKLHGDIDSVYLRGAHVVQDGKVILEKTGKYIKRGNKQ